ncbi:alpha/beta fold hydrolase [Novosphingobium taihuense]|uniref:Pimeloyl-ACP methyl ester carboxylesterase n=2 Tax=Novosphingobium taihuense TaxID=260085 RepID=A0A7W7EVA0_9SPHN|nr:alpha/beta fold hydrolase [Novosphingobium taihuense]MBB4614821.1 pimeloyl-ACP methyl ester carboxylesterase [Novosphingobium taihuense]
MQGPASKPPNPRFIRRGYTACRFGHMHFRTAGPDDETILSGKPAIVLLHQNPSSSFEYEQLIAHLATTHRVYAFDTPGYGMSDAPPAPAGMAGYAAAFSDALDALGLETVDLYGFHTGALLAAELAILRPETVRKTVMTGIPMYDAPTRAAKLAQAEEFPAPDEEGKVIIDLLQRLWTYVVTSRDKQVPLAKAVLNFADKAGVLDRFSWAYKGVWGWDFARLSLVPCPVLVLQPAEDLRAVSLEAAQLLSDAVVRELPDLDRDIFDIAPEILAHEIRSFLD